MPRSFLSLVAAFALSACGGGTTESYPAPVSDTFAKLSSAGYAAAGYALPGMLMGLEVKSSFQAFPDRTATWKFTHKGRELARVEASVDGDEGSSSVTYRYIEGEAAGDFPKLAWAVDTHSRKLLLEGMDAQLEGRTMDPLLKDQANAQLAQAMIGEMFQGAAKAMEVTDEQRAKWDQQDRAAEARVAQAHEERVREYSTRATQPSVQLGR